LSPNTALHSGDVLGHGAFASRDAAPSKLRRKAIAVDRHFAEFATE
jgi:hypothetical protein